MSGTDRDHRRQKPISARSVTSAAQDMAYDVIIIGGGINGSGIARAAARAGYQVLLVEKEDFGWGTTWRSTKLIHGGLRYLEHAEFGLVFESLNDQKVLLHEYPDMVRPISFLLPVYQDDSHRVATIGLGLQMYDALSIGRSLPSHRRYSPSTALLVEPALSPHGLKGAFAYSDCQVAYPERLCIQTALEARDAGAVLLNHTEVTGFVLERGRVRGVDLRERRSGGELRIMARLVVNAAGPWVDGVLGRLAPPAKRQVGGTRGAHLVVDYAGRGPLQAVYAEARSDHRPFFIVPWRGLHLIGTTDTPFDGSPDNVMATEEDINYLLGEANALLPGAPLERSQVAYAYAGVRPLPVSNGATSGAISRRHLLRDHASEGYVGLLSIIGGKLSTYRSLANQVLALIERRFKPAAGADAQALAAMGGRDTLRWDGAMVDVLRRFSPILLDHLRSCYGPRLASLLWIVIEQPELVRPICPHGPDIEAQVVLATRYEQAETLSDVLLRRTGASWNRCLGLDCSLRTAALMASELGWHKDRVAEEIANYSAEIRRTFVVPSRVMGACRSSDASRLA